MHSPEKGMELIKAWEKECAEKQGLETIPVVCLGVGITIFNGRYAVSKMDGGRNKEDYIYARSILSKINRDAGQQYDLAQEVIKAINEFLP